jgi:hypothetical protein
MRLYRDRLSNGLPQQWQPLFCPGGFLSGSLSSLPPPGVGSS